MSLDPLAALDELLAGATVETPWRPSRETLTIGVVKHPEFDRVRDLPTRPELVSDEVIDRLTAFLKSDEIRVWDRVRAEAPADWRARLPEGRLVESERPEKPERLRPIQARALQDAFERGGLFAPIGVGHGKFLISTLLPTLFARAANAPARKWLLFVPANLLGQTRAEIAAKRRHWDMPALWPAVNAAGSIRVESYDKLSSAKSAAFLDEYAPTDIVCDEVHKLKNQRAARTKRFLRYFREHTGTRLFAMSGTITRRTLRDYWHLIHLALPRLAPLPRDFTQTESWAQALDDMPDNDTRRAPGVLLNFCDPFEVDCLHPGWSLEPEAVRLGYIGEDDDRQAALLKLVRRGFRRRLMSTPGVVGTSDDALGTSLVICERIPPAPPDNIVEAFRNLRATWQTPNGDEIDGGVNLWRHAGELSSGFWSRWVPPAPAPWLFARQHWNRAVRYVVAHNRQRLDSPLQVWNAVEAGELSPAFGDLRKLQEEWIAVRDSFDPNPVPQWESSWLVEDVLRWFGEQVDDDGKAIPGIAWVHHVAVGEAIEALSGGKIRYFGGGAEASREILTYKGPCVASIAAHGTGKNLQRYSRALVVHSPSGGDTWEQMIARLHRPGQEADEVRFDVYLHVHELRKAFDDARRLARYIEDATNQPQKLLYARIDVRSDEDVMALAAGGDPLWKT